MRAVKGKDGKGW